MKIVFLGVLALLIAAQAYVRLAPLSAETWHVDSFKASDPGQGGALEKFNTPLEAQAVLKALSAVAQVTPRTTILAGSVPEGRMSFVTRSMLWGFPDVTTISVRDAAEGTEVAILARLRFGKSDIGVNGKRITAWRAAAGL